VNPEVRFGRAVGNVMIPIIIDAIDQGIQQSMIHARDSHRESTSSRHESDHRDISDVCSTDSGVFNIPHACSIN
jgi:hypothetical protein